MSFQIPRDMSAQATSYSNTCIDLLCWLLPKQSYHPTHLMSTALETQDMQTQADSITMLNNAMDIMALFSVLLLSEPGTEAQDGTLTKLAVSTQARRQPHCTESQWHPVVTPYIDMDSWVFIFTLMYPGKVFRSFMHFHKNRHLALVRISSCFREFTVKSELGRVKENMWRYLFPQKCKN